MTPDQTPDHFETDAAWRSWGEHDPYFSVITDAKYRRANLTKDVLDEFFRSGHGHVRHILNTCRRAVQADFAPTSVLDFGCGVGRLLVGFAEMGASVVGVDVSEAMLAEARKNCVERGHPEVVLKPSDDELSQVEGHFDLVHSVIVLQHISPQRGRVLFRHLIDRLNPRGIAALHLTYAKAWFPDNYGQPPAPPVEQAATGAQEPIHVEPARRRGWPWSRAGIGKATPATSDPPQQAAPAVESPKGDPQMLMHVYSMNEILYLIQSAGVRTLHSEFTNHGGEMGMLLYFQKPRG